MYDNFTIDYELPIAGYIPEKYKKYIFSSIDQDGFQCKDLECEFSHYHIDKDGFLYRKTHSFFEIQKEEKEFKKVEYHGTIGIYNFVLLDEDDFNKSFLIEYNLKFTDGLLKLATMTSPNQKKIYELHKNI